MEEKIVYTITVRTNPDGIRAAAIVKNVRRADGTLDSTLTTAFAQEDLDLLMAILDGKKSISNVMGGEVCAN
jgi:hypothetical protein